MSGVAPSTAPLARRRGQSTLEVCIASALLSVGASASLGGAAVAQRDATLAALRQTAVALAEERVDRLRGGITQDEAEWQARVAAALPGGRGSTQADGSGLSIEVRWRAPGVDDARCPGTLCVVLHSDT